MRGIVVSDDTVWPWSLRLGQEFANQIGWRLLRAGDMAPRRGCAQARWVEYWLWRSVDQTGVVLDLLVRSRCNKRSAERRRRKLLKRPCRAPRS